MKHGTKRTENTLLNKNQLVYLLVFVVAFLVFFYLQSAPVFADPDSFYHAKIGVLIKEAGEAVRQFPWLQFTVLKEGYTDHHFLYHLLLVPFVSVLPPLIGTKLAAIIFASLAIVFVYWFLRAHGVRGAIFYALFLLVLQPFIFRISLAKVPVLSLIFLLVALYFLHHRKKWQLFVLSFFYVWLYAGWPLIIIFAAIYLLIDAIMQMAGKARHYKMLSFFKKISIFNKRSSDFFAWPRLKLLAIVIGGTVAGLFLNPYFPKNLKFYWYQTYKIAVVNYQKLIGVGAEWYPYDIENLFRDTFFAIILFSIGFCLLLLSLEKQSKFSWAFLVFSFIFLALTLKSRRNVEYFVPMLVIFCAFSVDGFIRANFKNISKFFKKRKSIIPPLRVIAVALFCIICIFIGQQEIVSARKILSDGYKFTYLEKSSRYLHINASEGDIVFHSDWDEFPSLFYHNSRNYYIIGLDPTFMYEYDQQKYWQYVDVTLGRKSEQIYDIIKESFKANYVLATQDHQGLIHNLSVNFYFEKVYEDEEAVIFKVL